MLNNYAVQTSKQLSQLPILRHSERALNELRPRASTSLNHVLRVVERDPALAFELFTTVNRNLKQVGKPLASNIRRAILVFGVARYLDHCKSFQSMEDHFPHELLRPVFNHLGRSHLSARLAQTLARIRGGVNPEDAFSFGLARDLDDYASKLVGAANLSLDLRNMRVLLPGLASPAVSSDPLHSCAEIAFQFSSACQYAWDESVLSPLIETAASNLSANPEAIRPIIVQTIIAAARETKHFNDFPSARFMMNPGPQKPLAALQFHSAKKANAKKNDNAKANMTLHVTGAQAKQTTPASEKVSRKSRYLLDAEKLDISARQIIKATEDLAIIGSTVATRTRAIPFALNVMMTVLKANKVLFIAYPTEDQLIVRIQVGEDRKPAAAKLALNLNSNPLLRKVLETQKPRHISATQLQQHAQLFEPKLMKFLGSNEAYCLPLVGKKKIIGIILARFEQKTTEDWATHFKLCNKLATHLVQALSGGG